MARPASDVDPPPVVLHDPVHHGQSHAGPLPRVFRREEGLEDPGEASGGDPHAGVGNRQGDIPAGRHLDRAVHFLPGVGLVARFDPQRPAVGHRVPGVDAQVEEGMLQLARGPVHRGKVGAKLRPDVDGPVERGTGHRDDLLDHPVQVRRLHLVFSLPREPQELPGQLRRAKARPFDGVGLRGRLRIPRDPVLEERGIPHDRLDDVVEVVRDAACQGPHRLHLLCVPKPVLQLPVFGDVGDLPQHKAPRDGEDVDVAEEERPVLAADGHLFFDPLAARQHGGH